MQAIYRLLRYDFQRVMLLDVDQCVPVAVENAIRGCIVVSPWFSPGSPLLGI